MSGVCHLILVNAASWLRFLGKTHKEGVSLPLAKEKLLGIEQTTLKAFSDDGGQIFAANVKKAPDA